MILESHPWYTEDPHSYLMPPRILEDGRTIWVMRTLFNARIGIARTPVSMDFEDAWCYHDHDTAVRVAIEWDGNGEPDGWNKHPSSGRYRADGKTVAKP